MNHRSNTLCRAASDGECHWPLCPQERDGEPQRSGRHCPLDAISPDTHSTAEAVLAEARILRAPNQGE